MPQQTATRASAESASGVERCRGIMIHQPLGGAQGQAADVRIQAICHLRKPKS